MTGELAHRLAGPSSFLQVGHNGSELGQELSRLRVIRSRRRMLQQRSGAAALGPFEHLAGGSMGERVAQAQLCQVDP